MPEPIQPLAAGTLKERLLRVIENFVGIFERAVMTIQSKVNEPAAFLVAVLFTVTALDVLFLGKLKFIEFLITQAERITKIGIDTSNASGAGMLMLFTVLLVVLLKKS